MTGRTDSRSALTTRERVLREAATLFIENGFQYTPVSAIAARLGTTKAALYYYYASKDELLLALVSPLLDRVDELLREAQSMSRDIQGRRVLLERYADVLLSDHRAAALLRRDLNVSGHPGVAPRIDTHVRSLLQLLAPEDPDHEELVRARAAMTIIQGLITDVGERSLLESVPISDHRAMLLRLAFGIMEQRFHSDSNGSERPHGRRPQQPKRASP
jgi:AcrR family transcriptional regulator